VIEVEDEQDKE